MYKGYTKDLQCFHYVRILSRYFYAELPVFLSFFFTIVRIFWMKWLNNSILQNKVRNLYCELMNLTYYFLMKLNYGYLFKDMLKVRWGIFLLLHHFRIKWILLPQLQSLYSSNFVHSFGIFTDFMISKIDQLLFEFIC